MGVRKPNRETATIIHHTMERCVVCDAWYEWDYIQRRIDNPNTNIARKA